MPIQSSDLFLINRGGANYKISYIDLLDGTGVLPTDLVMVQSGGTLYQITYADLGVSGPLLEDTEYFMVERGNKVYSERVGGQLISAGDSIDLVTNVPGASDQNNIIKFGWFGGRAVNGVSPQIVNSANGKVAFLGSNGDVSLDASFCAGASNNVIKIYGQFDEIRFNGSKGLVSLACSTPSAAGWGSIMPNPGPNMGLEMFDNCTLLTGVDRYIPLRNMSRMFRQCVNLNDPNITNFITGQVTSMRSCFYGCRVLNQPLIWNTSKVTDMNALFVNCIAFNQNINSWATGLVTDFNNMFFGCYTYNQPLYLWDTSSVTSNGMTAMFRKATVFNRDLNNWCVSAIPYKPDLFDTDSALTQANEPIWGTCP